MLTRLAVVLTTCVLTLNCWAAEDDIPRLADGKPDLNGIWQTMSEANWSLERQNARHAPMLRSGPEGPLAAVEVMKLGAVIAMPPSPGFIKGGDVIPYTEQAQAKRIELQKDWVNQDPEVKCYLPGIPRATYLPHPFQIFQNDSSLFMAYQFAGATREIYLTDPGEAPVDSWMGWSHGHWDGDTLVVDVTAQMDGSWLDRTGTHHSIEMKVTERYTLLSNNHMRYQATIEDPQVFTKPWSIEVMLYRRMEANMVMLEFKCVEFVEELIYGDFRRQPLTRP